MNESIPASTDTISHHFDTVSTLLNELCDIISDLTGGNNPPPTPNQSMGGSIPEILSTLLMSRMNMGQEHGSLTKEWQVHQNDSPPTLETENQSQ